MSPHPLPMRRLACLLALVLAPALAPAAQTVRDSVRMELSIETFYNAYRIRDTPRVACGAAVIATWPNVLQDLFGSDERTYGYADYSRVATEGMYIPQGYGEADAPEGFLAHSPQLGGASDGPARGAAGRCAGHVAAARYRMNGGTGPLNGRPFRVTDWYAVYTVPSGEPVALFTWEATDGLSVAFDASFESDQSRETDASAPGGKRPVVAYAWDFGDGQAGTGARPTHTYDAAGEYTVVLTVTDDDGEEASREATVEVTAARLEVDVVSADELATQGDTLAVVARVTNTGDEAVTGFVADRGFTYVVRVPDALADPAGQVGGLEIELVELPEDDDGTVTRDRLEPGASVEVTAEYVVTRSATYRVFGETDFAPATVFVDWDGLVRVEAQPTESDTVEVRQPCAEADDPCATTQVDPPPPPVLVASIEARPRTVALGAAFEVWVVVRNDGEGPAEEVGPAGAGLTVSSTDGGAARVTASPSGRVELAPAAADTLVFRLEAEAEGTLAFEVAVEGEALTGETVEATLDCATAPADCAAEVVEPLVVTETSDEANDPDSLADGVCDVDPDADGLQCTLRAAIETATALGGTLVGFDIDGEPTVLVESALPPLTDGTVLDGTTQPGTGDLPTVRIDGAAAGAAAGLRVEGAGVTVRGFAITQFGGHGVHVASGDGAVLEGLLVGTDATGAEGLGNGGDGIHVSGGAGHRIGAEAAEGARRSAAINIGSVVSVSNLLNGLYIANAEGARRIRARRSGARAEAAPFFDIRVNGLIAGLFPSGEAPVALPNRQNGVCLRGARGVTFVNPQVSDALRHAFEIEASQDVRVTGGLLGLRRARPRATSDVGQIIQNLIHIRSSIGIDVGGDGDPVQGGGAGGWFMDVEDSEDVTASNLLAGLAEAPESLTASVLALLRNRAGGLRVADSPRVTVGAPGLLTVLANSGGDASASQAGLHVLGRLSAQFRALNLHLGTTADGLLGVGNAGSGLLVSDGVPDAEIGGAGDGERVVAGGNGGYGFFFRDITPETTGRRTQSAAINLLSGQNLLSGIVRDLAGDVAPVPNAAGGFCFLRVQRALMQALSAGASGGHGVEILESERIELPTLTVGSLHGEALRGLADLFPPEGDGVFADASALVAVGGLLGGGAEGRAVINGVGGRGIAFRNVAQSRVANLLAGEPPPGSSRDAGLLARLGAGAEGAWFQDARDVRVDGAAVFSSGRTTGGGGLFASGGRLLRLLDLRMGEMAGGVPARTNAGPAVTATGIDSLFLSVSRFTGHVKGLLAANSTVSLDGTTFDAPGDAVDQTGGTFEGVRNVFRNASGAALRAGGTLQAVLRGNTIEGNAEGVTTEAGADYAGGPTVVAPENWWGAPSGPGGAGPGSGDPISAGVDAAGWLTGPPGVLVLPESHLVETPLDTEATVVVRFDNVLVAGDRLDVTVADERGWVTSPAAFAVDAGGTATVVVAFGSSGSDAVTVRAVSQADASLAGEATVWFVPPGEAVPLTAGAEAGATRLEVGPTGGLEVGEEVVINPGGATEERGVIAGFGSIVLADPLRFPHRPGERVVAAAARNVPLAAGPPPTVLGVAVAPNPVAGRATVTVGVPSDGAVQAAVFDALGREVARLADGPLAAGAHPFAVETGGLAAGVYVVRVVADGAVAARTFTVVR